MKKLFLIYRGSRRPLQTGEAGFGASPSRSLCSLDARLSVPRLKGRVISILVIALVFGALALPAAHAAVYLDPAFHPSGAPTVTGDDPVTEKEKITASQQNPVDYARLEFTQRFITIILGLAGVVAVFFIINNAWYLVISAGREELITQHKKGLMWALIGLVLIVLSYSIIRFIISIPFQADEAPAEQGGAGQEQPPA